MRLAAAISARRGRERHVACRFVHGVVSAERPCKAELVAVRIRDVKVALAPSRVRRGKLGGEALLERAAIQGVDVGHMKMTRPHHDQQRSGGVAIKLRYEMPAWKLVNAASSPP